MNLKTLRVLSVAIALCFLFALVVNNAYKYLPNKGDNSKLPLSVEDVNSPREYRENSNENSDSQELQDRLRQLEEDLNSANMIKEELEEKLRNIENSNEKFKEIEPVLESEKSVSSDFFKVYFEAVDLLGSGDLSGAVTKFQNSLTAAENDKQSAKAYLGVARVYALQKRYGSAISNAQRAQNMNPSYESQVMLAKLHYVTGNVQKAEQLMKTLLEKEFSTEF